jgi:hypothetical protein
MSFDALLPWIIALAVIYVPMITYIGFELWRAPLIDENGNVIRESKNCAEHHPRTRASLTPAE